MNQSFHRTVYPISAAAYVTAGEVSRQIKNTLRQLGIDSALIRKISVCAYEAEINIIIHSYGGTMSLILTANQIALEAEDNGPGIPDLELAMREGWSTADEKAREMGFGAGMGLSNMKHNTDDFTIRSDSRGTHISMKFNI